ncbi:MAG: hypothetical protein GC145_09100 [Caulobacter sp.]|nr:hypothetical protein [Caulobacter sp.]
MSRTPLIGLVIAMLLAACAGPAAVTPGQGPSRGVLSAAERAACARSGGQVERAGMLGYEACIRTYGDAGRRCHDAADCQGQCFAADDPVPGQPGRCQRTSSPFGCRAAVRDGVVQPTLCVD